MANGHPPLLVKDDGRRGFYLVAPFPLYCFDMDLVRRAHEEAAADAHLAGVTLIRITCDYAFAQNQGRTQEGGLISCPVFMSDVTRASTEGLTASGRIAVILKHLGPYQYTAGPDYTALPIERVEFLETVLPRYAGGFEAGARGVMMSFVALNGVPAHADPFLRDLVKAGAGPGAIIESDYDGIYELYGGFGYAASPKEAAVRAFLEGGVHIDLCSLLYLRFLPELVEEGRVSEDELRVRAAEMLQVKESVGVLDDPLRGTAADREERLLAVPGTAYRELARASVVLLRPARPDPAVLPMPADGAGLRAGAARRPGPGGLARRLLEPREPAPRAGDDAARGDPAALAGRALCAGVRLCVRGRGGDRGGGGGGCGGDACRRLPRRAARMERGVGGAGRSAAAGGAAAAGRSGCAGRTPGRSSSSSSPPGGRCIFRARSRRAPTRSSGRRTWAATRGRRSGTSWPGWRARRRGSRTDCRWRTGSPRASTRGRRGSTGRRCRWWPGRRGGGSGTTGAPTISGSGRGGRRPTGSARGIRTRASRFRTGR